MQKGRKGEDTPEKTVSDRIGYAGRGLMCGTVVSEFACALNEYSQGNTEEAVKYSMIGFYFALPLFFDGLMRLGVSYRKGARQ
jgi:hypothetical protein